MIRQTRSIDILEYHEAERLLDAASPRSFQGCRARVLVCLLWRVGLRVSSAAAVRPCDLRLDDWLLRAPRDSLGVEYWAVADELVQEEIKRFLPLRYRLLRSPAETLPLVLRDTEHQWLRN